MTADELPDPARRALERHGAFEAGKEGYTCTTTPFDAVVTASEAVGEHDTTVEIEVRVPTLDAVVVGETVGPAVEDGWFETLELRLEDAYHAADASDTEEPVIERDRETITATYAVHAWNAGRGIDAAKAVIDYVEGTYVQGIIPGYNYDEPVAGLLNRAQQNADSEGGAGEGGPGGMPL